MTRKTRNSSSRLEKMDSVSGARHGLDRECDGLAEAGVVKVGNALGVPVDHDVVVGVVVGGMRRVTPQKQNPPRA